MRKKNERQKLKEVRTNKNYVCVQELTASFSGSVTQALDSAEGMNYMNYLYFWELVVHKTYL